MAPAPYILVVDDDADIRESFQELLEDSGYVVRTAVDGEDAISMLVAQRDHPALILLDLMMPRKNGFQVLEMLRGSVLLVDVPVVVVSANMSATPAGAVAWLRKPLSADLLLAAVGKHMRAA